MADAMGPIVFVVVVVGGLGSLAGCFIASILIGMVQTFAVVVDYSLADLLRPSASRVSSATTCSARCSRSAGADRRAPAVPDAGADPDLPAARPARHARHMSSRCARRSLGRTLRPRCCATGRGWRWSSRRAAVVVLRLGAASPLRLRALDAQPDGHDGDLRAVVQHAAGPGRPAVLRPRVFFGLGGYCASTCSMRSRPAPCRSRSSWCRWPAGFGGLGLRRRVRLRGDQAARDRLRDDHARASASWSPPPR